jgi:(heptosyl)LPS beta-1,4-glucosyltransferase
MLYWRFIRYSGTVDPISVTIITRNEEAQVAEAIASVDWADEVIVLDCGSDDTTVEKAAAAGAQTVVERWRGFGAQRNRAAELVRNDWVLALDADERCSPGLACEVNDLVDQPIPAAYQVRRRNYFAGQPIRHWPWVCDRVARLYDRRRAVFSAVQIHESLVCEGEVGKLRGWVEHYSYSGWSDYDERQLVYTRLGAEQARQSGRRPRPGDLQIRPLATFVRHWLGRGYLLGGHLGWRLAVAAARGTRSKYQLLRQESG